MSNNDLVAAIDAAKQQLDLVQSGFLASGRTTEELQAQFAALGADDKAGALADLQNAAAEQTATATAAQQLLEEARARAEALRGSGETSTPSRPGAASVPKPTKSHGTHLVYALVRSAVDDGAPAIQRIWRDDRHAGPRPGRR